MKVMFPLFALTTLLTGLGCGQKKDQVTVTQVPALPGSPAPAPAPVPGDDGLGLAKPAGPKRPIEVKNTQKAKWKAISLQVQDLSTGKLAIHVIGPDKLVNLPGTNLSLKVLTMVSDFVMDHGVIKPGSDTMRNPAAQVELYEKGKLIWKGWLFTQFPDDRKLDNDRIVLRLLRIEPAK